MDITHDRSKPASRLSSTQRDNLNIKCTITLIAPFLYLLAGNAVADSLEGVWKIESGRWFGETGDMEYPGDPAEDEGAQAYRVFTDGHHVFISSFPAMDLFNTSMSRYEAMDGELKMERVVTNNPKQIAEWTWAYELDGDRLTLTMEGIEEIWVRIE